MGEHFSMLPENLFDRIVSIDNLRSAWVKAEQYARTEEVYFDTYAYNVFGEHLEANLVALRYELLDQTYRPAPLRYISVPKGDQVRKLYFAAPRDCVVIQAVINIIGPTSSKLSSVIAASAIIFNPEAAKAIIHTNCGKNNIPISLSYGVF